jgi:hypothetical protein
MQEVMKFSRYLAHRLLDVDADADKKHLKPVNRHKRIPMKKCSSSSRCNHPLRPATLAKPSSKK